MKFKLWAQDHQVLGMDYTISTLDGEYESIGYTVIGEIEIPVNEEEARKAIAVASEDMKAKKKADLERQLAEINGQEAAA